MSSKQAQVFANNAEENQHMQAEITRLKQAVKELCNAGQEALDHKDGSGRPILQEAIWKYQNIQP